MNLPPRARLDSDVFEFRVETTGACLLCLARRTRGSGVDPFGSSSSAVHRRRLHSRFVMIGKSFINCLPAEILVVNPFSASVRSVTQ